MRTAFFTLAMLSVAATAHAEVPQGPDAIHGAFARMLERTHDVPQPLVARGEPDPLATLVASALQVQRTQQVMLAGGSEQ